MRFDQIRLDQIGPDWTRLDQIRLELRKTNQWIDRVCNGIYVHITIYAYIGYHILSITHIRTHVLPQLHTHSILQFYHEHHFKQHACWTRCDHQDDDDDDDDDDDADP